MSLHATASVTPFAPALPGDAAHGLGLGSHLEACQRALGRTFTLRCLGERLHGWVGPRFCTTVFAAAAVLALLALVA